MAKPKPSTSSAPTAATEEATANNGTPNRGLQIRIKSKPENTLDGNERTFEHTLPVPDSFEGIVSFLGGEDVAKALLVRQIKSQLKNVARPLISAGISVEGQAENRLATDAEIAKAIDSYKFSAKSRRGRRPMSTVEKVAKRLDTEEISLTDLQALQAEINRRLAEAGQTA